MNRRQSLGALALACGLALQIAAQERSEGSKPKAPLVTVVGCATRLADAGWMLTNATNATETQRQFSSAKEIEEARKQVLGSNRYKLVGVAEFLTKEELLKHQQRAEFTPPEVANATGQLQDGRKLVVKGLLITAPSERRLNLVSVQRLADSCK